MGSGLASPPQYLGKTVLSTSTSPARWPARRPGLCPARRVRAGPEGAHFGQAARRSRRPAPVPDARGGQAPPTYRNEPCSARAGTVRQGHVAPVGHLLTGPRPGAVHLGPGGTDRQQAHYVRVADGRGGRVKASPGGANGCTAPPAGAARWARSEPFGVRARRCGESMIRPWRQPGALTQGTAWRPASTPSAVIRPPVTTRRTALKPAVKQRPDAVRRG